MRDFALLCIVAAGFIYGYFIMKMVDVFLENNRRQMFPEPMDKIENEIENED